MGKIAKWKKKVATINNTTTEGIISFINESNKNLANQILSRVPFIGENNGLQALFLLLIFIIIAKTFLWFTKKYLRKLTKKTNFEWDNRLLDLLEKPIAAVIVLIGLRLAIIPLNITEIYKIYVGHFINSLIIIAGFYSFSLIGNLILDVWGKNFADRTNTRIDNELLPLFHRTIKVILFVIGFLFILKEWGINIVPLLASLGIAGIAIGLALQPTLSNIFAGIALILDKNFKKGDVVEIDNVLGTVEDIGLRTTRVKTMDNDIVTFPNNNLANLKILNHLQPDITARISIHIGVGYGSNITKVKKIIFKEIEKNKKILTEPKPVVLFTEMGDYALKFGIHVWVHDFNIRGEVKDELLTSIYEALNKNKINIPFPTSVVHLKR